MNPTTGVGKVIKGWDQALVGRCVKDKIHLTIPPQLGYGDDGTPDGVIPGGATLEFTLTILEVEDQTDQAGFIQL